jgi:hypothetical protein
MAGKGNPRAAQRTRESMDADLLRDLHKIDASPHVTVTAWEARFLNDVLPVASLTVRQREVARQIVDKYLERA